MTNEVAEATQIISIDPMAYVAQVYAPFFERLEKAKIDAVAIKSFDVVTKEGMALAVKQRAIFRSIRVEADKAREFRKAPIIKIGKLIQERYNEIEAEITVHESRFDDAIKAEEKRKDDEKNAAIRAEQEKLEAIQRELKAADERKMAEDRAAIAKAQAELEAQRKAQADADKLVRDKIEADMREAADKIEADQRASRMAIEEANRKAQAEREAQAAEVKRKHDAEEAELKTKRDKLEAERREVEESQRKEREAQEQREHAARAEVEAKAKAEQDAKEAAERAVLREQAELMDGMEMMKTFVTRFGGRAEFKSVVDAINKYLRKS